MDRMAICHLEDNSERFLKVTVSAYIAFSIAECGLQVV